MDLDSPTARENATADKIHANNCAVRNDFFRAKPFPIAAFKKQCGFDARLSARGHATRAPPMR